MKISVIHPSRGRPEQAVNTIEKWINRADTEIEYIVSLDTDDYYQYKDYFIPMLTRQPNIIVWVHENRTAIEAINVAAAKTTGDILIVVSDDFDCPEHWDTCLLKELEGKEDFCVKVKDGNQPFIMTLPIMDRTYYNRFEYIYNPEYLHMFADTEMSCVAWMLGKYTEIDTCFTHCHYTTGKMPKDLINVKNDRTWGQGELLFKKRRRIFFGLPLSAVVNRTLPDISGLNIPRYM